MKWKKGEEQIIKQDPQQPCLEAGHESRVYDVKKIQIFQGSDVEERKEHMVVHFKTFQDQETSITKEQFYTELNNASAHQVSQASADATEEFLY